MRLQNPNQARETIHLRRSLLRSAAGCVAFGLLTATAQTTQPPQSTGMPMISPIANRAADANAPAVRGEQQEKQRGFDAADTERKRQLASDCAMLLQLATGLKAEVDKTTKDTLSLTVIRKANEIERLARNVKDRTKDAVKNN
jgi:hypothetical protein